MKQKLIDLLSTFGYPVSLQGSYEEGSELPEHFFTFWNYDTDLKFYSNNVNKKIWYFNVYFYSTDPSLVNEVIERVGKLLRQNDFQVEGDYDINSGVKSYTAREIDISYIEIIKEEN